MRSRRTGSPPKIARVSLRRGTGIRLAGSDALPDRRHAQPMVGEQIVVSAIVVDKFVLQGKGIESAPRLDVPCDLLGLRRKPSLRDMLLDDDDMLVMP